ncbi:hypothetical protein G6F24_017536 [Rhizopus arrhizus]|nr:hypothetical protein G6F24_017536 [Rhizopus arrhizus]
MALCPPYLAAADAIGVLGPGAVRPGRGHRFRIRPAGGAVRRAGRVLAADPAPWRRQHAGLVRRHVLFADGRHRLAGLGGAAFQLAGPDFTQHRPPDDRL